MKRINYIFIIIAIALLNGCKSDFLEKEPPLNMSEKDVFSTQSRIEAALLGVYTQIKNNSTDSYLGGKSFVAIDAKGEDFVNISNNLVTLYGTYNMQTDVNDAENIVNWEQAYLTINNANVFLAGLEGAKTVAGDSYGQFKSEALFLRALTYYYLNMFYAKPYKFDSNAKSVPLRLTPSVDGSGNDLKRSPVKEVFDQILADLSDANIQQLGSGVGTSDGVVRATQGAAHSLRMRVYMAMENWDSAITEGNAVTGYSLVANSALLYSTPISTEAIFSLPMADNNVPNTQESVWEYYYDGQIMVLDESNGIYSKAGYNNSADTRISSFIASKKGRKICTKFTSRKTWVPIFRLAEIKLNLAECYAQKGGAAEVSARSLLKEVRRRSLPDASDAVLSNAQIDALTGASLKAAIYNEKRLEFLGEGTRSLDIHRRAENYVKGTMNIAPSGNNYIWPIPSSETSINKAIDN